jgi:hypothetical protein
LPPVRRRSRQRRVPSALGPYSLESTTRGTIAKIEPSLDIALGDGRVLTLVWLDHRATRSTIRA